MTYSAKEFVDDYFKLTPESMGEKYSYLVYSDVCKQNVRSGSKIYNEVLFSDVLNYINSNNLMKNFLMNNKYKFDEIIEDKNLILCKFGYSGWSTHYSHFYEHQENLYVYSKIERATPWELFISLDINETGKYYLTDLFGQMFKDGSSERFKTFFQLAENCSMAYYPACFENDELKEVKQLIHKYHMSFIPERRKLNLIKNLMLKYPLTSSAYLQLMPQIDEALARLSPLNDRV